MSLLDLPTLKEPGPFLNSVPADSRNFSRPQEPDRMSTIPDFNMADDTSRIKEFQTFFGQNPTGEIDINLINSALQAEHTISRAIGKPIIGLLFNPAARSFQTTVGDLKQALELIKKLPKK